MWKIRDLHFQDVTSLPLDSLYTQDMECYFSDALICNKFHLLEYCAATKIPKAISKQ